MVNRKSLHAIKTVAEFESGYWYALELKAFAREIGIANSSRLRKDELEAAIKQYLASGTLSDNNKAKQTVTSADRLDLKNTINHYVSNKQTKAFIMAEALKICPQLPKKSGVWYWTNRWRETQIAQKNRITYLDLIQHFVRLSTQKDRLPQIPSARFNNFITDFIADKAGSRDEAVTAWEQLKTLESPKTYTAWKAHHK